MRIFENYPELQAAVDLAPLMPGAFRFAKAYAPAGFRCARCKQAKPFPLEGISTGYGRNDEDEMICFACCGEIDEKAMRETGKACLYLTQEGKGGAYSVSNWPGTYKARAYVSTGRHNIAGRRYDAYFNGPDGKKWHGVTYGDNTQVCHCKRLKKQA